MEHKGLLLIECVTRDRWVYDSRYFPFIKGCADSLGFRTRWLCFGVEISQQRAEQRPLTHLVRLAPADTVALDEALEELHPSHAVLSHPLAPEMLASLTRANPDLSLLCTSDHPCGNAKSLDRYPAEALEQLALARGPNDVLRDGRRLSPKDLRARVGWLLHWLGEPARAAEQFTDHIVGSVDPTYDAVMANEAARRYRPHTLILGGIACNHRVPLASNPHYQGLDLSTCEHDTGCGYCTWSRLPASDLAVDPVETASAQLQRIVGSGLDGGRFAHIADVLDVRLFSRIDRFAETIASLGLPPTQLCFEPRIDSFLAAREKLRAALDLLGRHGHSLYLFRMGLENLNEEENHLFNKHISLAQIDECAELLAQLKREFYECFDYDPTFGYITCSPWTTLPMLKNQVELAIEREFDPLGIWLYTPVLFYKDAPIVCLAERDGSVLTETFEDLSLLYEPAINAVSFDSLIPWRFKDHRMSKAFALIVRFCAAALRQRYPDTIFEGDALYTALLAEHAASDVPLARPDRFALEVINLLEGDDAIPRSALLERALASYRQLLANRPSLLSRPPGERAVGRDDPTPVSAAQLTAVRRSIERVLSSHPGRFEGLALDFVGPVPSREAIAVGITLNGEPLELRIERGDSNRRQLFRFRHFAVYYVSRGTAVDAPWIEKIRLLVGALDRLAAERFASLRFASAGC